jgi:glutaredoxin
MNYEKKDVTENAEHMEELKRLMGRFITPTIVIDGEVLLGFGMSFARIVQLLGLDTESGEA